VLWQRGGIWVIRHQASITHTNAELKISLKKSLNILGLKKNENLYIYNRLYASVQ
jgi:hypothetical protein